MVYHFSNYFIPFILLFWVSTGISQNIEVDANTYSPQQLIESILIDSGCIDNVEVIHVIGGVFEDGDKSYGYFNGNGSDFPFEKGLVLSTGKLKHVPGPNTTLSDDDAPGWTGDRELEQALNISGTVNATIIEFDFVPRADNISFRYIFASEEYQEGDRNTCRYSDAFAFLIKPIGGQYSNIALVPGTSTPVLVTTVHSGIPGACPPINETYFERWNGREASINFNGQTKVLIAESSVIVNQAYHIKLVIADHSNYRYDSAVFLEGGSFNISANLGPDRSFITNNPLCEDETYLLDATPIGSIPIGYKWFRNEILIPDETSSQFLVHEEGIYKVEIDFGNGCIATDEVLIEYNGPVLVFDTELYQCDPRANGFAIFNLFNAEPSIINGDAWLRVYSFHKHFEDAENNVAPISNPRRYSNTQIDEVVYARVVSEHGCVGVAEVTLKTTTNTVSPYTLASCSDEGTPGYARFDFADVTSDLLSLFGNNAQVSYYSSSPDAISETNTINSPYTNTQPDRQQIFARISGNEGCLGTTEIELNVINKPEFEGSATYIYCKNTYPQNITISSGLIGTKTNATFIWSTGETSSEIQINEAGAYSVTVTRSRMINGELFSCTNTNDINVIESEPAQVSYVLSGSFGDQTLNVSVNGLGDYWYALNDNPFQDENVFENLKPGKYTLYVSDKNGCGTTTLTVYVLGFPKFFTPNNDGHHDFWQIKALNQDELQIQNVEIFDRFGKLIHLLDLHGSGWDGSYDGKNLPSSDYWYKASFRDGSIYKGHFSLKR